MKALPDGRSKVSAARANVQVLAIHSQNLDGAIAPILLEVGRLIGNGVLTAELVLNLGESIRHFTNLEREEGVATGRVGNALEHFVTLPFAAGNVCADGVDDHLRALRHLNGFFAGYVALVIVAVAEQDDGATHRP